MDPKRDNTQIRPAEGAAPTPASGSTGTLGRYRILGELGRGGMGIVLLGEDPDLQRPVAIKTLPHHLADDPVSYSRFQREARLLASLNHPNVATIHSLEVIEGGAPILTMERIVGETLASRLRGGALTVDDTLRVGTKIARAIEAAHERGVIHRDLKPGNVMLRADGEVKVLDFGLARVLVRDSQAPAGDVPAVAPSPDASPSEGNAPPPAAAADSVSAHDPVGEIAEARTPQDAAPEGHDPDATTTRHRPRHDVSEDGNVHSATATDTNASGTIGYMSPEQLRGLLIDERTDLFALGCVLFECATGHRAFDGDNQAARMRATLEREPPLDRLPATLPRTVRETIRRCLSKDPKDRPRSVSLVRRTLEENLERALFARLSESRGLESPDGEVGKAHNLPQALTSFIGRDHELLEVGRLLASHSLVTLTGAGGSGKTRLAIEAARSCLSDGSTPSAWLVELSALTDPGLLDQSVMAALGIVESHDRSARESIFDHLGATRTLLVLDNCEHLLEAAAALVQELLQRCPQVRVLATSREPLGLQAEHRFVVPPLSSRDLAGNRPVEELRESEAVTLFMERARQVRPGLALTTSNLEAVVGICRRLDGLPLALELAASRVRMLDPGELFARLDDRFRILTGGSRDKLPHHRTLLASIEWSHDQLEDVERILFRRLGVFVGGFTLEAVEAICADERLEKWEILDGLGLLIDKSLIEPSLHGEAGAAPRYRMLETFREYAAARAEEAGETPAVRERFIHYWKNVALHAAEHLNGPDQKSILLRLDQELGNVREAIRISLGESGDAQVALLLTGSLMRYWIRRSNWSEGLESLRRALARPDAQARDAARATALNGLGTLEYFCGRYADAIVHLEDAIALFNELGMRKEAARARTNLGNAYAFDAQYANALREHEGALATAREIGHEWLMGAALANICNVSEAMGDLDRVEVAAREAVEIMERTGDRNNLLMALNWVGAAAYRRGRFAEGITTFTKGLAIAVEYDDRHNIGLMRLHRGLCLTSVERHREADEDYLAALEIAHTFNEPNLLTYAVEAYAHSARHSGAFDDAAAWLGLADRLRVDYSARQREANVKDIEELRTLLRHELGDAGYAAAEARGRAMSVDQMLARVRPH